MKIDCERVTYLLTIQMMLPFYLFVGQMVHICGEVILLRGNLHRRSANFNERKYICLSEDDGGALVWNDESSELNVAEKLKFHSINVVNDIWINCKMNANTSCLESWSRVNWTLTNSEVTPMGPVFDQRWEDFEEYKFYSESLLEERSSKTVPLTEALSVSIRSMRTVAFLICNFIPQVSELSKLCYWIKIDSVSDSKAFVDICKSFGSTIPLLKQCLLRKSYSAIHNIHMPVVFRGWRTFVISLKFLERSRSISFYDTGNRIFTFEDKEEVDSLLSSPSILFFDGAPDKSFSNMTEGLFRFHIYDFLYTADETAVLTSPIFQRNTQRICIQLLVGLCAECDADVMMIDSTTREILKSVTAKGSANAAIHGLPMWQLVKLDGNFSTISYSGSVQIQLIPKLIASSRNSLWAIANVRQCPNKEVLRKGVISILISKDNSWPNLVTCQKLSYNESIIVTPLQGAENNTDLDICPEGRIGPGCLFSCEHDLNSLSGCAGTKICSTRGCICSAGYQDTCFDLCDNNWYGYKCKNKCGSCESSDSFENRCNKVTGECINGCANTPKTIYVPPLCHIGMEPRTPVIVSTNSTSIRAKLNIIWKKEYEQIMLKYSFTITGENYTFSQPWDRVFQNMTLLTGYFDKLNPGSIYNVKCTLLVKNITFDSDWQIVETDCEPATFNLLPTENSIIIDRQITSDQFPCPPRWYHVSLGNRNTGENIFYARIWKFPHTVSSLPPYTFFNVTVLHSQSTITKQTVLLVTYIRTLQSISTRGLDIQYFLNSSTQVTLTWKSPSHLNKPLYLIKLKINFYFGCEDTNKITSDTPIIEKVTNKTATTVQSLHPYASYTAQVTAYESSSNSYDTEITFNTPMSDIPTELFTQLKVENWTLSWKPPTDCSTILGPLMAKIKITGVSPAVKHFIAIEVTSRRYFDLTTINNTLLSAEQYQASIYVIRELNGTENPLASRDLPFKTPSTVPPTIKNLEVIEIDTRKTLPNMVLHLRWLSRLPSLKQQLHYYNVTSPYTFIQVKGNDFCDLWDDHICASVPLYKNHSNIQVFELYENGTELSSPAIVYQEMLTGTKPDKPAPFTYTLHNNSIIDLVWYHPWRTVRRLQYFLIEVKQGTSYLKRRTLPSTTEKLKHPVKEYKRNYTERLYLFPSTLYRIYIRSVTITNETSLYNYITVQTPSTASFDDDLRFVPHDLNSTISLNVPRVRNDTYDSVMHIILEGPNRCKNHSEVPVILQKQANIKATDAWQAAEISTDEIARNNFTFIVGDNETYGGVRNCPVQLNRSYEIIVILTEQSSVFRISNETIILRTPTIIKEKISGSSLPYEMWLIIIIVLFISTLAIFYYICRRQRRNVLRQILSENELELWQNAERTIFDFK